MDPLSLWLGLAGIIATVLLSDPIIRLAKLITSAVNRRRWSAEEYRKGRLRNRRHFGFETWAVNIKVDAQGSTTQEFDARIINLSRELLRTLFIPFFSDAAITGRYELRPWARSGRKQLPISFDFVDERRSQGRIAITHVPPLKPGERRRVHWGLSLPRVFSPGDEYYDWDVEVPHYSMQGSLEFAPNWKVLYAKWRESQTQHPPSLNLAGNVISWSIMLPEPGRRLHLLIGLTSRPTGNENVSTADIL